MIQGFVEVPTHDDSGFNGNAEQSDVADPHRYAEVVTKQPLKNEAARQCIDCRENEDSGLRDGVKHHVQQQEDDKKYDRQNELQPRFCPQLKLVLARPFVAKAGKQREFLLKQMTRMSDETAIAF